jgi:hypothetical protein
VLHIGNVNGFKYSTRQERGKVVARKEATAFDYISDGSGRDSYILQNSGGLKREYKGGHANFTGSLRQHEDTPYINMKLQSRLHPWQKDITQFLNW